MKNFLAVLALVAAPAAAQYERLYEDMSRAVDGAGVPSLLLEGSAELPDCIPDATTYDDDTDVLPGGLVYLLATDGANTQGWHRCTATGWVRVPGDGTGLTTGGATDAAGALLGGEAIFSYDAATDALTSACTNGQIAKTTSGDWACRGDARSTAFSLGLSGTTLTGTVTRSDSLSALTDTVTIPQADWSVSDQANAQYIHNKPTIPTTYAQSVGIIQAAIVNGQYQLRVPWTNQAGTVVNTQITRNQLRTILGFPTGNCGNAQVLGGVQNPSNLGATVECQNDQGVTVRGHRAASLLAATSFTVATGSPGTDLGVAAPTAVDGTATTDQIRIRWRRDATGAYDTDTVNTSVVAGWTATNTLPTTNDQRLQLSGGSYTLYVWRRGNGNFTALSLGSSQSVEFIIDRVTNPPVTQANVAEDGNSVTFVTGGTSQLFNPGQPVVAYWNLDGFNFRNHITHSGLDGRADFARFTLTTGHTSSDGTALPERHRMRFAATPGDTFPTGGAHGLTFYATVTGADTYTVTSPDVDTVPPRHFFGLANDRYDLILDVWAGTQYTGKAEIRLMQVQAAADTVVDYKFFVAATEKRFRWVISDYTPAAAHRFYFLLDGDDTDGDVHYSMQVRRH